MTRATGANSPDGTEMANKPARPVRLLEDNLFEDLHELTENMPDPLAPIGEHIAHTLAWGRVRADAEEIAAFHEQQASEREAS